MARVQVHVGQTQFTALTSAQMDAHIAAGISGYVVYVGSIAPLNPPATGQTVPATILTIENAIKANVTLAHGKAMAVSLRVNVLHTYNGSTPYAAWFDGGDSVITGGPKWSWAAGDYYVDPVNSNKRYSILAAWRFLAEMCARQAIDELMFDQEEYGTSHTAYLKTVRGGTDQFLGLNGGWSWRWDYLADTTESHNNASYAHLDIPANTHTEAETRAQVRMWGGKLSQVIRTAAPKLNVSTYYNRGIAGNQWEWEFETLTGSANPYRVQGVQADFWGGFLQDFAVGTGRFRSCDAGFYRTAAYQPDDLTGMQAARDKVRRSYLALVNNPAALHPKLFIEPFRWPEQGDNATTQPYPGDATATQWLKDGATRAEWALEVYAHQFPVTTAHWTDPGIFGGTKAAAAITGPQPPTPPYTASTSTGTVTVYYNGGAQGSLAVTFN